MDDQNAFVILTGVCLIFGTLSWAGFTAFRQWRRQNRRRGRKRRTRTVARAKNRF